MISLDEAILKYTMIYDNRLIFDTSFEKMPSINRDYAPQKVFESPFLNADYNSGVVTISKRMREEGGWDVS